MNAPAGRDTQLGPAVTPVVSLVLIGLLMGWFWAAPFRVEGDTAYAVKAAQQYVDGHAHFNSLRLVDPHDLARDVQTWLFWWPPVISALFVVLLKLGLSVSEGARLVMAASAISGALGWSRVSAAMGVSTAARLVAALPPVLYVVNSRMYQQFSTGDALTFAAAPWLVLAALAVQPRLREGQAPQSFLGLCALLGGMYWIKYSALLTSAAMLAFLLWGLLREQGATGVTLRLAALGVVSFAAPIALLWLINRSNGGDILESSLAASVPYAELWSSLVSALASAVLPLQDAATRFLRPGVQVDLLHTIGLGLLIVVIIGGFFIHGLEVGMLALLLVAVPILGLLQLASRSEFNFLVDASRHLGPSWVFLLVVLAGTLAGRSVSSGITKRRIRSVSLMLTAAALPFAVYTPFVSLKTSQSAFRSDAEAKTGLEILSVSAARSGAIVRTIASTLRPDDVIVPATYWLGMETWLPFDGRLLPLTNFYQPLGATHGHVGADYFSDAPFETSKPVRVVLIATDPYARADAADSIRRIKSRFCAVEAWRLLMEFPSDRVSVWAADVKPALAQTPTPSLHPRPEESSFE